MSPDSNIENISKKISENVSDVPNINYIVSTEDSSHNDSATSEDDDDSYQTEYAGYQLLSQENLSSDNESEETKVDVDIDDLHTAMENFDICIDYQDLVCSAIEDGLPSTGLGFPECDSDAGFTIHYKNTDFEITESHAELIKKSMIGFSLPSVNIPEWAKNISDDQLKETLQIARTEKSHVR